MNLIEFLLSNLKENLTHQINSPTCKVYTSCKSVTREREKRKEKRKKDY